MRSSHSEEEEGELSPVIVVVKLAAPPSAEIKRCQTDSTNFREISNLLVTVPNTLLVEIAVVVEISLWVTEVVGSIICKLRR